MPKHATPSVPSELIEQKDLPHQRTQSHAGFGPRRALRRDNWKSEPCGPAAARSAFRKTSCFNSAWKKGDLCYCKMQEQKAGAVGAHNHMPLPNKALRCYRVISTVSARSK